MKYERITADQIRQVIKSKKPTAAAGPDGWSRQNILRMAPDLLQSIADLFHWIENGHPWPLSLVTGVIHALEKKAGASQVKHFRPITIFSLIYRAWSSVCSRQILAFLTDQVPLKCFGNVPKKIAKDMWFGIQRQIEDHYFDNKPLTGCMLDLVKAFNHLSNRCHPGNCTTNFASLDFSPACHGTPVLYPRGHRATFEIMQWLP